MVTSTKSNHSCLFENADERHVGRSDSRTAPQGDSQCRGNEIHAWKTYMEMKGFLSASKSGEQRSQSFARNARASSRRSRCTCDLARIPHEPRLLQLLPYNFWFRDSFGLRIERLTAVARGQEPTSLVGRCFPEWAVVRSCGKYFIITRSAVSLLGWKKTNINLSPTADWNVSNASPASLKEKRLVLSNVMRKDKQSEVI